MPTGPDYLFPAAYPRSEKWQYLLGMMRVLEEVELRVADLSKG